MADLSSQIQQAAADPAAAAVDGQSVTARPVGDVVQADQYLAMKAAARKRRRGIAYSKLITPGAAPSGPAPAASFDTPGGGP